MWGSRWRGWGGRWGGKWSRWGGGWRRPAGTGEGGGEEEHLLVHGDVDEGVPQDGRLGEQHRSHRPGEVDVLHSTKAGEITD